jgi:hypothetical protein
MQPCKIDEDQRRAGLFSLSLEHNLQRTGGAAGLWASGAQLGWWWHRAEGEGT